jgi:hypothetical protein
MKTAIAVLTSLALASEGEKSKLVEQIEVTSGEVEALGRGKFRTEHPVMRGTFGPPAIRGAQLRLTYEGPTDEMQPLTSGQLRRQVGLKLRAMNSCNVLYVMWHCAPTSKIEVSVKRNPQAQQHRECGDRGYIHVKPERSAVPPTLSQRSGDHLLRVEDRGREIEVWIDEKSVWRGVLPPEAAALRGPAGIRSDNVRVAFQALTFEIPETQ